MGVNVNSQRSRMRICSIGYYGSVSLEAVSCIGKRRWGFSQKIFSREITTLTSSKTGQQISKNYMIFRVMSRIYIYYVPLRIERCYRYLLLPYRFPCKANVLFVRCKSVKCKVLTYTHSSFACEWERYTRSRSASMCRMLLLFPAWLRKVLVE